MYGKVEGGDQYAEGMTEKAPRARRRDAEINRERLLAAARDLFARSGHEVPLEDIARAADVTRTTLYRNFPSREALAVTLYAENVTRLEARAEELENLDDGVIVLLSEVIRAQRDNRALALLFSVAEVPWLTDLSARTEAAFAPLLARGLRAGLVHPGVEMRDLMMAFPMVAGVLSDIGVTDADRDELVERAVVLVKRALFRES